MSQPSAMANGAAMFGYMPTQQMSQLDISGSHYRDQIASGTQPPFSSRVHMTPNSYDMAYDMNGTSYQASDAIDQHDEQSRTAPLNYLSPYFYWVQPSPQRTEAPKHRNSINIFKPSELKEALVRRHISQLSSLSADYLQYYPQLGAITLNNYIELVPLEHPPEMGTPRTPLFCFGPYFTHCYKAFDQKHQRHAFLRRFYPLRQISSLPMSVIDTWQKISSVNVVQLQAVFQTNAFGDDQSIVFVYDYHAGAETLLKRYYTLSDNLSSNTYARNSNKDNLPEANVWELLIQLCNGLASIHSAGLAARTIDPSKILMQGQQRVLISSCGILDVLHYEKHQNQSEHQQRVRALQAKDWYNVGQLLATLCCGRNLNALAPMNVSRTMTTIAQNYSNDLKTVISMLLSAMEPTSSVSINTVMPHIGIRFFQHQANLLSYTAALEDEIIKEVDNSRLFRLISKLDMIIERKDMGNDWNDGPNFLLSLFRNYLFHAIGPTGAPLLNMAHVVDCLNKLDSGSSEALPLMNPANDGYLIYSTYAQLKKALDTAWAQVKTRSLAQTSRATYSPSRPLHPSRPYRPAYEPSAAPAVTKAPASKSLFQTALEEHLAKQEMEKQN